MKTSIVDKKYEYFNLKSFAMEWEKVPNPLQKQIESHFNSDMSAEYYHGMLAGLAACLAHKYGNEINEDKLISIIKLYTAYVSNLIIREIKKEES
jgi:hypothetical protein